MFVYESVFFIAEGALLLSCYDNKGKSIFVVIFTYHQNTLIIAFMNCTFHSTSLYIRVADTIIFINKQH